MIKYIVQEDKFTDTNWLWV